METGGKKEITGAQIKAAAMITMLIDHIAASLLEPFVYRGVSGGFPGMLCEIMRIIGRLAFPLYIFLLIEGFYRTRSRLKYLLRLALFAAVSEIPFDLAFNLSRRTVSAGTLWERSSQNVFFTLAIGLFCLCLIHAVREKFPDKRVLILIWAAVTAGGGILASVLATDYSWAGVAAVTTGYLLRELELFDWAFAGILIPLVVLSPIEAAAAADVPLLARYRGSRGKQGNKWLYYAFYPAHLLLLGLIRLYIL